MNNTITLVAGLIIVLALFSAVTAFGLELLKVKFRLVQEEARIIREEQSSQAAVFRHFEKLYFEQQRELEA